MSATLTLIGSTGVRTLADLRAGPAAIVDEQRAAMAAAFRAAS